MHFLSWKNRTTHPFGKHIVCLRNHLHHTKSGKGQRTTDIISQEKEFWNEECIIFKVSVYSLFSIYFTVTVYHPLTPICNIWHFPHYIFSPQFYSFFFKRNPLPTNWRLRRQALLQINFTLEIYVTQASNL